MTPSTLRRRSRGSNCSCAVTGICIASRRSEQGRNATTNPLRVRRRRRPPGVTYVLPRAAGVADDCDGTTRLLLLRVQIHPQRREHGGDAAGLRLDRGAEGLEALLG